MPKGISQTKGGGPPRRALARKCLSSLRTDGGRARARLWRPRPAFPRILLHRRRRRRQSLRVRSALRAAMPFDFEFRRSSIIQVSTYHVGGDWRVRALQRGWLCFLSLNPTSSRQTSTEILFLLPFFLSPSHTHCIYAACVVPIYSANRIFWQNGHVNR